MSDAGRKLAPDAIRGWVTNSRIGLIPWRSPPPRPAGRRPGTGKRARRSAPLRKFTRYPVDGRSVFGIRVEKAAPFTRGLKPGGIAAGRDFRSRPRGEGRPVYEGIETLQLIDNGLEVGFQRGEGRPVYEGIETVDIQVRALGIGLGGEGRPVYEGIETRSVSQMSRNRRILRVEKAAPFTRGLKPYCSSRVISGQRSGGEGRPVYEGIETR